MTRRIVTLVVLAVAMTGAALMAPPDPPAEPDFAAPLSDPQSEVSASASVWHCPWVNVDTESDAAFLLASARDVDATISLPSPILNDEPDITTVSLVGPGSRVVDVGEIVVRGDTPGFVEFDGGPAVAAVAVAGDGLLTADRCVAAVPKIWHLPGGTTREGKVLRIRLFNPFPDDVKVSISGASEFGPEPLPEFNSVLVNGRSWVNVDLNPVVPLLDDLALVVAASDGVVIPVVVLSGDAPGADQASWPGSGLSTEWFFANATQSGLDATLAVTNPGASAATVSIDLFAQDETVLSAVQQVVPAGAPLRVALTGLVSGVFGLRVSSSEPIGAVVIAEDAPAGTAESTDEDVAAPSRLRLAGTVGSDRAATAWLLPGAGGIPEAESSIWVLNPGEVPVTASLEPLGVRNLAVDKLVIEPGRTRRYAVPDDISIASYLVSSSEPVVVALAAQTQDSIAFLTGLPIDG